jgi:predicted ATPase/DNA-binding SARP family transcriptional activator
MGIHGHLRIELLGGFAVGIDGRWLGEEAWRLRKAKSLVKLLALAPRHRMAWEQLGEALWPQKDAAAMRNNFHQTLRAARDAIESAGLDGREALRLCDSVVSFGEGLEVTVDVDEFIAAAGRAQRTGATEDYRTAAGLYAGELLPEDRYEDWADAARTALKEQHATVLLELVRRHRERDEAKAAIDVLYVLLGHDELHEGARRELMELLAESGRRQESLAEYEKLREKLRRSLEADPDPETRRLYRRLLAGSVEEPGSAGPDGPLTAEGPLAAEAVSERANNLPAPASSFVGREREIIEVERLLASTRLLTLTGVGGSGKTRLALEVARRQLGGPDHGVWLVDLAPTSDDDGVPRALAEALGIELPERGAPVPAIAARLVPRQLLLVLDNCEHLIAACAELVAALLRSCPDVAVLTTSREALRIEGEVAWRVPSLALPDLRRLPRPTALAQQAAVQLFCERAAAAHPGFQLTARNAATVAELCVRVDGMPLALELAAARVRMLSPAQILTRLAEALDLQAGGSRAAPSRQRSLRATLDWSHDLLDEAERVTFRRLSVFAGSFALEAAEHVCGGEPLTSDEVIGLLGRLVDQSLVITEPRGEVARYRLLEIVRQHAAERLDESGERAAIEQRHRDWYRGWAEDNDPERAAAAGEGALHHFDIEHDNLRSALRSALANEPEAALRLATSLWRFWLARGHFAEGRRWLEDALEADPAPSALRARGLIAITVLDFRYVVDPERLGKVAHEVVDIHRGLDDAEALAQAYHLAAITLWTVHRGEEAAERLDRADTQAGRLGANHLLAAIAHTRGVMVLSQGRPVDARSHFDGCGALLTDVEAPDRGFFPAISIGFSVEWDEDRPRAVFEETLVSGHRLDAGPAAAYLRFSQAWAARAAGDLDAAIAHATDSVEGFAAAGWDYGVALADNLLGSLLRLAGDPPAAHRHLDRSLLLRARLGDRRATGVTLGALGLAAAADGDQTGAHRHLWRALELFERIEDGFGTAGTLLNLGVVALRAGDLDTARPRLEQVGELRDAPGGRRPVGWAAVMLAEIAHRREETEAAAEHLAEARALFSGIGEHMGLAHCQRLEPSDTH